MTGSSGRWCLDLAQQGQPVHAGHVDVGQDDDQLRLDPLGELVQRLLARAGEMQHIGALAHLAAKALAEQFGDIGFVIDDQDADAHAALPVAVSHARARGRRTVNSVKISRLALDRDRAAMLLRDDVVADRQPEAGAFAGRLGREERLEQLVAVFRADAGAVVAHPDLDRVAEIARRHSEDGPEAGSPVS